MSVDAGSEQKGFELFDEQKLGASDFQQKVTYQRALEGEIARTIEQVDGVQGAQVQLVLPEDSLFADEETPATAAVMLTGPSDGLESGAVRGIAQLVASSVKGLKTENVTITDGTGQLLWPQGDGVGGAGGGAGSKLAAETRYERALQASLDALLTQTLGPGKARVQVKADLNVDQTTREQGRSSTASPSPSKETTETERLRGGGTTAGGTAGTGAQHPDLLRRRGRRRRQLELPAQEHVGRERRPRDGDQDGRGAGRGQQAADRARRRQDRARGRLRRDPERRPGRRRATTRSAATSSRPPQIPFAKAAAAPKAGPVPVAAARPAQVGRARPRDAALPVLHGAPPQAARGRGARHPAWLREIEEPIAARAARGAGAIAVRADRPTLILPPREQDQSAQALEQLMDREPERVAAQVRQWMSED